jgi:hypothetical protein
MFVTVKRPVSSGTSTAISPPICGKPSNFSIPKPFNLPQAPGHSHRSLLHFKFPVFTLYPADLGSGIHSKPPINDYTSLLGPSLLKQTLGLQNRQHGQYLGQTSEYDGRLISLSPFNGRGEYVSSPGTLRRVSHHTHFLMKSESQDEVDDELVNLDLVESIVHPHGRALVDLYFRIIHPSYPIMYKKVFLEKYERTYREFTPPVLAAVYILALNWWSYDPELVNLPKPDIQKLEKLAPQMMSAVLNRPKLSTVQAGLLLLQRPDGDSWALTGQLVAVGMY